MSGAGDDTIIGIEDVSRLEQWITEYLRVKDIDRSSEVPQSSTTRHNKNTKPRIGKVPGSNNEKYYKPSEMSIGPIHARNYPRDHYKYGLARKFIQENEIEEINACKKIFDNIKDLRECYDREVTMPKEDDDLVWIFFLDGCSTLGFITGSPSDDLRSLRINHHQISLIIRDLFLLENQLPFRVLELLIDLSKNKDNLKILILEFIDYHSFVPLSSWSQYLDSDEEEKKREKPAHLLDLLRLAVSESVAPKFRSLLDLIRLAVLENVAPKFRIEARFQTYRLGSVQELKWSGIQCRPSFEGLTFSPSRFFTGHLDIPPIIVDDTTKTILMNLVAYEMRDDTGGEVSGYIWFLNSLMNHAEDVKELRSSRILSTNIGSDEKVVEFFSEIQTDLVPNISLDYLEVFSKLEEQIHRRRGRWMAEAQYKHFASPWTIMALIAGGLALFLTAVQTGFTVFSNK